MSTMTMSIDIHNQVHRVTDKLAAVNGFLQPRGCTAVWLTQPNSTGVPIHTVLVGHAKVPGNFNELDKLTPVTGVGSADLGFVERALDALLAALAKRAH